MRRAQDATLRAVVVPESGRETSWDLAAVRGIIASGLHALSARDQVPAQQVPWNAVLWHLRDEPTLRRLVETTLPEFEHAALGPDPGPSADPAARTWWWLNRTWRSPGGIPLALMIPPQPGASTNPLQAYEARRAVPPWDGMTRGIATAMPDPPVEVCTDWAIAAAGEALLAEHGGLPRYTRVRVIRGEHAGECGYVQSPVWQGDDAQQRTLPRPIGYEVDLDEAPHENGMTILDAADLSSRADGLSWPRRRAGSVRAHLRTSEPAAAHATPGSLLDALLERAANPQVVPSELRARMHAAKNHTFNIAHHGATPRPHRCTWMVIGHAFHRDLIDDNPATLTEVRFTRTATDQNPVVHLVTDMAQLLPLIESQAGRPVDPAAY